MVSASAIVNVRAWQAVVAMNSNVAVRMVFFIIVLISS